MIQVRVGNIIIKPSSKSINPSPKLCLLEVATIVRKGDDAPIIIVLTLFHFDSINLPEVNTSSRRIHNENAKHQEGLEVHKVQQKCRVRY